MECQVTEQWNVRSLDSGMSGHLTLECQVARDWNIKSDTGMPGRFSSDCVGGRDSCWTVACRGCGVRRDRGETLVCPGMMSLNCVTHESHNKYPL